MTRALHMRRERQAGEGLDLRVSLCGMLAVDVTEEAVTVTCRLCRDRLRAAQEHAHEPPPSGEWLRPPRGASRLTQAQRRAIARSVAGDDDAVTRSRFRGWAALHEHRARVVDDGCPVRSTSDPGRFGARSHTSGGAIRMPSGRDDVIEVDRVLDVVTRSPRTVGPHVLGQAAQLAIYLARAEGRPLVGRIAPGRKGIVATRVPLSAAQVAERLGSDWTAHHVGLLVRGIRAVAYPLLVAKGILPPPPTVLEDAVREDREMLEDRERAREERAAWEAQMKLDGYDLEGWKEIADALGVSEDTAQRYRSTGLPVFEVTGSRRVIASRAAVVAWNLARVQPKAS